MAVDEIVYTPTSAGVVMVIENFYVVTSSNVIDAGYAIVVPSFANV